MTRMENLLNRTLDPEQAMDALTDLGLLIERHTQNRYGEKEYLSLLGNDQDLYELRLTHEEVERGTQFLFYHLLNIRLHPVTAAWCLGKCYGQDILKGITGLLDVYRADDDVCEQLLFSVNALYDFDRIKTQIRPILDLLGSIDNLPKTHELIHSLE